MEFSSPRNSPGQNTGVGFCSLLQGIFLAQGSNPGVPHCRWILYQLSHQGKCTFPFLPQKAASLPVSLGGWQPSAKIDVLFPVNSLISTVLEERRVQEASVDYSDLDDLSYRTMHRETNGREQRESVLLKQNYCLPGSCSVFRPGRTLPHN